MVVSLKSRLKRHKEEEEVPIAENDNVEGSLVRGLELLVCAWIREEPARDKSFKEI